jgi:hypothetical protein
MLMRPDRDRDRVMLRRLLGRVSPNPTRAPRFQPRSPLTAYFAQSWMTAFGILCSIKESRLCFNSVSYFEYALGGLCFIRSRREWLLEYLVLTSDGCMKHKRRRRVSEATFRPNAARNYALRQFPGVLRPGPGKKRILPDVIEHRCTVVIKTHGDCTHQSSVACFSLSPVCRSNNFGFRQKNYSHPCSCRL